MDGARGDVQRDEDHAHRVAERAVEGVKQSRIQPAVVRLVAALVQLRRERGKMWGRKGEKGRELGGFQRFSTTINLKNYGITNIKDDSKAVVGPGQMPMM